MNLLWLLGGLLYVGWPIDIIPDFIPIAGWIDDLGVLGYAGYMAMRPR